MRGDLIAMGVGAVILGSILRFTPLMTEFLYPAGLVLTGIGLLYVLAGLIQKPTAPGKSLTSSSDTEMEKDDSVASTGPGWHCSWCGGSLPKGVRHCPSCGRDLS